MTKPISYRDWSLRRAYRDWLQTHTDADVAMTATLCQSISVETPRGKAWVAGDPVAYHEVYKRFIKALSRRLYGKTRYERTKVVVPNAAALEGDGKTQHYHLHILLKRPPKFSPERFDELCREVWLESPWAKPDVDIQLIRGDWAGYCVKKGPSTLFVV